MLDTLFKLVSTSKVNGFQAWVGGRWVMGSFGPHQIAGMICMPEAGCKLSCPQLCWGAFSISGGCNAILDVTV